MKAKWVKTSDRLPSFPGLYKVKWKDGRSSEEFFMHYSYEATWLRWIDTWYEQID